MLLFVNAHRAKFSKSFLINIIRCGNRMREFYEDGTCNVMKRSIMRHQKVADCHFMIVTII